MVTGLQPRTDYFYCDECRKHVPCVRLKPGVWEIRCPNCAGECALCGCHLAKYCFGKVSGVQMVLMPLRVKETPRPPRK